MPELRWTFATRQHDWRDLTLVRRVFTEVGEHTAIEEAHWLEWDEQQRMEHRVTADGLCDLLEERIAATGSASVMAGSARPQGWQVSIYVPRHERGGSPMSYSLVVLRFHVPDAGSDSSELATRFLRCHTADETEYAALHPQEAWVALMEGPYRIPVTFAPMFVGVLWANFLGPGHATQFDLHHLLPLDVHLEQHARDDELKFVVTPFVTDAERPDVLRHLVELTNRFRDARRVGTR